MLQTPYRDITRAVLAYVDERRRDAGPHDVIGVFVPEYVVGHWWEHLLHNQSALRLKTRLLFRPGVFVTSVPAHLRGDGLLDGTASTPASGARPDARRTGGREFGAGGAQAGTVDA